MERTTTFAAKIVGAFILFTVTLFFTLLPNKLTSVKEKTLKSISCFCGGVSFFFNYDFKITS